MENPKPIDSILLNFPNKTIEIPPLGLPMLQAALKKEGFNSVQYDYNLMLKDFFLEVDNLKYIKEEILPFIWENNFYDNKISNKIVSLHSTIHNIEQKFTIESLVDVKKLLQNRNYKQIFCDSYKTEIFTYLLPLITKSSDFFELIISNPIYEQKFSDLFVFKIINNLLEKIIEYNPLLVGVSIVEMQRNFSLLVLKKLKYQFGFKGKVVVGGSDITYFSKKYLKMFSFLDYEIYQEGEIAIVKLMKYLSGVIKSINKVPNLIYRENNNIIKNKKEYQEEFTDLIPDFEGLPLQKYITHALPIQASRGCSWGKCTYCKHYKTYGKNYYPGDGKKIVDQIQYLKEKHRTSLFHFVDDDFPLELKNIVVDEINKRNIKIYWLAYSRFDSRTTKEMLRNWYKAGLYVIEWGLESASEKVLKKVKKGITLNTVKRLLFESYSVGILNKVFMFHNLPEEDYEDLWLSVNFLKELIKNGIIRPFYEILTPLELLIGTPLYEDNIPGKEKDFKKVFFPRGELVAQAGYIPKYNYNIKKTIIEKIITDLKNYIEKNNILEANDEVILFDVILEKLRIENKPLKIKTRVSYS